MDYLAHVGLVDAHAKDDGGHHALHLVAHKLRLEQRAYKALRVTCHGLVAGCVQQVKDQGRGSGPRASARATLAVVELKSRVSAPLAGVQYFSSRSSSSCVSSSWLIGRVLTSSSSGDRGGHERMYQRKTRSTKTKKKTEERRAPISTESKPVGLRTGQHAADRHRRCLAKPVKPLAFKLTGDVP